MSESLTSSEKALLRSIAIRAVEATALGTGLPDPETVARQTGNPVTDALRSTRGAFVTLTHRGELRGCIGHITGHYPLIKTVLVNAQAAASRDPRFPPVSGSELKDLEIEISALTQLDEIGAWTDISLGEHGILLDSGGRQAVFLPQVPGEQGWDLERTLTELARKAGLAPDGWRRDTRFQVFSAEVF